MATRVQTDRDADAALAQRARYHSSADGFNIVRPPVPPQVFTRERDAAFAPDTPTGLLPLDLSEVLQTPFPATTPLVLARYARVRAGETLATRFAASGTIHYVVAGRGRTLAADDAVAWTAGDVFVLPGGPEAIHAATEDSVLWIVTNEPQLAFERLQPPAPGDAPVEAVHYPGDEIRRQLEAIHRLPAEKTMTGKAVTLSSAVLARDRTCLPSLTLAMNSLLPGEGQRAHRHNAVAVTLIVQGQQCHSRVGEVRIDWERHATMITPPGAPHSHHNEGGDLALFLIVQDGGLHYHCRTMGFAYTG